MVHPPPLASNFIIFSAYAIFLVFGVAVALKLRHQTKTEWLCANRTQTAIPIALNFIASALGAGILFSYPQLATITGVQGVIIFAITSSVPLLIFAYLGPIIRKKCPEGFVLTEWARQRYGATCSHYLSFLTLVTLFLYMVAELSAVQQIMTALTGIDGLRFVILECAITTIYTGKYEAWRECEVRNLHFLANFLISALGGFQISFITDNIQGAMVVGLVFIATITIGFETKIDRQLVDSSGLTKSSLLGWQLLYILPIAILTNDFFLSNFWIRAFASKTDKDLWIGVSIAAIVVFFVLTLVGSTGLMACWSGVYDPKNPDQDGSIALFYLLEKLPLWIIGIVLVMVVTLSTAAFDSLQSAMISTISNDLFRNNLSIWWIRISVIIVILPVVVIALKAPSILQIYLISDLISASTIPLLILGLSDRFEFLQGTDVIVGGLGGIFSVFLFGWVYFGNVQDGACLILLKDGFYTNDWSVFGAFVAAPFGGILLGLCTSYVRYGYRLGSSRFD